MTEPSDAPRGQGGLRARLRRAFGAAAPAAPVVRAPVICTPDEARRIIGFWEHKTSYDFNYFNKVDDERNTAAFWAPEGRFRPLFDQLDTTSILEIACGYGRHTQRFVERAGHAWLLDTSVDALAEARRRLGHRPNVTVLPPGDGASIPLPEASLTAVFSYDAMVHFEMETVFAYLRDIHHVLKPGGRALLHHSAADGAPGAAFDRNPGWRNFMSIPAFRHVALRSGFTLLAQEVFDHSAPGSDCLSLIQK